jgi:hypothetical protein
LRFSCGSLGGAVRLARHGGNQPGRIRRVTDQENVMQPLAAPPVHFRNAVTDGGAVFLRDIDDLHDADLDQLLADRLAESADALRAAVAAAELARQVARPAALRSHALGAAARRLAG